MTTDDSGDSRPRPEPGRRRSLRWAGALAGAFALGVALGGAGTWTLGLVGAGGDAPESDQPQAEAALDAPPDDVAPAAGDAGDAPAEEPPATAVPVTVRVSERARRAYRDGSAEEGPPAPGDILPAPESGPPDTAAPAEPPLVDGGADGAGDAAAPADAPGRAVDVGEALRLAATPPADGSRADGRGPSDVAPRLAVPPRPASAPPLPRGDEPAWIARATPATLDPDRPIVAVVIDDLGVDVKHSRRALGLPGPLTMAFLPYGYDLPAMAAEARARGHEILVHLPMEPEDADVDPGPHALMTGLDRAELQRRLAWNLGRFDHFVGLNNHMGSRFSADAAGMRQVMETIRDRGLLFLDSLTTRDTKGGEIATAMGVPHAVRDVFIDHRREPGFIRDQLARTIEVARAQGYAVAIGHPHEKTLSVLREWLPTLAGKGVQLAPISAVVRRRAGEG